MSLDLMVLLGCWVLLLASAAWFLVATVGSAQVSVEDHPGRLAAASVAFFVLVVVAVSALLVVPAVRPVVAVAASQAPTPSGRPLPNTGGISPGDECVDDGTVIHCFDRGEQ